MATTTSLGIGIWPSMSSGLTASHADTQSHRPRRNMHSEHHQQLHQQQHYLHRQYPAASAVLVPLDDVAATRAPHGGIRTSLAPYLTSEPASRPHRINTGNGSGAHESCTTARNSDVNVADNTHMLDSCLYFSALPPLSSHAKRRGRSKMNAIDQAQQAAKLEQKSRRREQNRNAQRRLRDRKEDHVFKLEGEVAQLRQQDEQRCSKMRDLEEMIRRLLGERQDLQTRLELQQGGETSLGLGNTLGLVDKSRMDRGENVGTESSTGSSRSNSNRRRGGTDSNSRSSSHECCCVRIDIRDSYLPSPLAHSRREAKR